MLVKVIINFDESFVLKLRLSNNKFIMLVTMELWISKPDQSIPREFFHTDKIEREQKILDVLDIHRVEID
jgi:hypothetical protein